jgi:putative MATE family efflux protein
MSKPVSQLDKDPIRSLFFKYYTPTLMSLMSVTIHQIINGLILGHYVGKEGIAAVGLFGPILIIFIAFALALMIGGGILIARSIGAKNYDYAQEVFQFTTTLALILGGIVAFSSPFITKPITTFLVGDDGGDIIQSTSDYMFWGFIWLPFFFLRMLWGNFVNSDGAPKISRNASLLAIALNIILDFLLIIIFHLGTEGASIATGISIFAAVVYLFVYISRSKGHISFKHFKFTVKLKEWRELFKYGVPSFVSEISFSLGLLLLNKSLVPFGTLAVSAFGLINHISFIFIRLFTAAMISALPIMSFNIGAEQPKRVLETLRFSLFFTFGLGVFISVIGFSFSNFLVSIFSGNESEDFKTLAVNATGLYFILFIAAGPNYILGAYLQAIGKSTMSVVINFMKGFVLIGSFLMLLPYYFEMGLNGIWLSRSLTEIGTLILIGLITLYNKRMYYSHEAILRKDLLPQN